MAGPEIEERKRIMREKALPPGAQISLEQRHRGIEKVAFRATHEVRVHRLIGFSPGWIPRARFATEL